MIRLPILLVTLSLAACGAPPAEEPVVSNNAASAPGQPPAEPEATSTDDQNTGSVPLTGNGAEAESEALAEIPTGFRGRWDSSREACRQPSSEMRLIVSADSLRFYESVGEVVAVRAAGEAVAVDLRTTGEGETRSETRTLSTTSDGRLSVASGGTTAERVRCP